jgi:UDP-N-acetylmuramoyl-L-alanyl-D-glutamate--2,6-diaminopimelate ligase
MLLKDLLDGLDVTGIIGKTDIDIKGIAYDSRKAGEGSLFVCIEGTRVDGHDYILSACEKGASALLVTKEVRVPEGVTIIRVKDTRFGLAFVSDKFFGHPSGRMNLIGVTGTKGKTTTTYMMKSILEAWGHKVGLIGTIQNLIGDEVLQTERTTPESYELQALFSEMAGKNVGSVVMEVSSQGLQLHRVGCCDFNTGIFTNITSDHIGPGEHSCFEEYLEAKIKLFKMCRTGLVNADSKYAHEVIKGAECGIITFGVDNKADIMASNIKKHSSGIEFDVITPWFEEKIVVNMLGMFNVYNALAAIGAAGNMGISPESIKDGLERVKVRGRVESVETGEDFSVIIDYAHNALSLENVLQNLREFAEGRLVCVFGCGGDRDKSRRFEMGEVSGKLSDFTVITSDNPRTEAPSAIIDNIETGIRKTQGGYVKIEDRRAAIRYAIENARPKDIILIAGKGHETYQEFKDRKIHFDDAEVAREVLKELRV